MSATQGGDDGERDAGGAGQPLDRDPGEGEEGAGEDGEQDAAVRDEALGAVAEGEPGREQGQAALEAEDRRRPRTGSGCR